jgi:hypothetical protein
MRRLYTDGEAYRAELGLHDADEFRGGAARLDTEGFTSRTLEVLGAAVPLPDATADDFGRVDSAERLRTPEAWQEWLGLRTGRVALVDGALVPETNYMARAKPGETTNGYVKTDQGRDGYPVWEKVPGE